jgi:tetratricopeptide (TPR) repeat protein
MMGMKYFIKLLVLVIILASSCSRKIVPSVITEKIDKSNAAFDFVYVEAIKQKILGNYGDALEYFEQCVKVRPESDGSYFQMAQIVLNNGDTKNAKKYLGKALTLDNKNVWYLMMLAGIYYQEKNLDSTIICYEKAVKYFPDKESLQVTLGNLYSENKNYERAINVFNALDSKYGVNESSTVSAIKNLMEEKKYDEALIKAKMLVKEYPDEILYSGMMAEIYRGKGESEKAREIYDQILEKNPDNAQVQLSLCDFLLKEKSYDEFFLFLNTVNLNNKISIQDKISLIVRLMDQSEIVKEKGDNIMLAVMVLEANYKDDDILLLLRPELLIKLNKLDEAAVRLEEIIKIQPDNYYAWEKLLLVYLQMKDYDKLLSKGEECTTRFNRSFVAKILYANGAIEKGKYPTAFEELRKAEILAGDNKDSLLQVLTMRADAYYRMKDYKKAFEIFEQALKTNKEDLTVMNNYAYYLAEQDMDLKNAERLAKQVVEKEKDNTTFLDTYGWVLYKRGKLNDASKVFEKIISKGEEPDAVWYEHYGYVLKKQKKCKEAIDKWNKAVKLDSTKTNLIKEIENCEK